MSYWIGDLRYEGPGTVLEVLKQPVGIGVAAGVILLLVFIIIMFLAYCRKSRESHRKMKSMQNQMDLLEAKVAHECKEGKK